MDSSADDFSSSGDSADDSYSLDSSRSSGRHKPAQARRTSKRANKWQIQPTPPLEGSEVVQALRSRTKPTPSNDEESFSPIVLIERTAPSAWSSTDSPSKRKTRSNDVQIARPPKRKRAASGSGSQLRARVSKGKASSREKRNKKSNPKEMEKPVQTTFPPWNTLPHLVLVEIFHYGSLALQSEKSSSRGRGSWLVRAARTCRAFAEPALTALYFAPPLYSSYQAHALLNSLEADPSAMLFNYKNKVRRLEVEVLHNLFYTTAGRGRLNLTALLEHTPQLEELDLTHIFDMAPYRSNESNRKWTYPESLFTTLDQTEIRLKFWGWNAKMAGPEHQPSNLEDVHRKTCMQSLKHLALVNYSCEIRKPSEKDRTLNEVYLGIAMAALPKLRGLTFETCETVDEGFLGLLPSNLEAITFINCENLVSESLQAFLLAHGYHLKELTLNHNYNLSLSFLTTLATSCPHLEILKVDMLFFSRHIGFDDSAPGFEALLNPDEVPTWPTSLRHVELLNLCHWTQEAAEVFFRSLHDSAPKLPNLRVLILKTSVKMGWRDRTSFRDGWVSRLQRDFLRNFPPPKPTKAIIPNGNRSGKQDVTATQASVEEQSSSELPQSQDGSPARRSRRLKENAPPNGMSMSMRDWSSENGDASDDITSTPDQQRGRRGASPHGDAVEGSKRRSTHNQHGQPHSPEEPEVPHEGMCEVFDVRIENTRPRENKFDENDFLDDEPSGDEDWRGDDHMPEEDTYAW